MKKRRKRRVHDPRVSARKALNALWERSQLRGRCWGLGGNNGNNPYKGSNITIADGRELVTISMNGKRELVVHQFALVQKTQLGKQVIGLLQKANLKTVRRIT